MSEQANLKPLLTAGEINKLLARVYPELNTQLGSYKAVDVFPGGCIVRLNADERHLRPGGTVSDRRSSPLPISAAMSACSAMPGRTRCR